MTAIIIFIGLIIGLNCIPLLTKKTFPTLEKYIVRILTASAILLLTFKAFEFSGYRLKGLYTLSTISWTFIISIVIYFVSFKNSKKKILTVFLLAPLIVFSIFSLTLGQVVYARKIDDTNKISVTTGGFLACGEIINITQTRFWLFDKQIFHIDNLCLIGINRIETVEHKDHTEFLIYHNGQNDSENPYKYELNMD